MTLVGRYNLAVTRVRRVAHVVWVFSLVASLSLMLLSTAVPGTGGPVFHWALVATGQDSLMLALSAAFWFLFEGGVACAIILWVFGFLMRRIALHWTYAATGTVIDTRQTGATVNNRPVMIVRARIDTPSGPVVTVAKKLFDLGSIPRPGDRVRLDISQLDATTAAYRGPA